MNYLYIINGKVMVSKMKKPEWEIYEKMNSERAVSMARMKQIYQRDLKEFNDNLWEAENAHISKHPIEGYYEITILKPVFQMAENGQPCEYDRKGKKAIITKLH